MSNPSPAPRPPLTWRWHWLPVVATVISRQYRLASWPLSGDEGFTLLDSTTAFSWANLRALAFAFNHYVTVPIFGTTELALRVGSALAAVLATGFVGWGLTRLYDHRVGLAAAWAMTLSPALLVHGQTARYYMQSFLLAAVVLIAVRLGTVGRARWFAVAALALVAGWFVVPSTVFVVPGIVLWALWNREALMARYGRPPRRWVVAVAVAGLGLAGLASWYVRSAYPTGPAHGVRYFTWTRLPLQTVSLFGVSATLLMVGGLWVAWSDRARDDASRTFLPLCAVGSVGALAAVFPFIGLAPSHFVSVSAPLFGLIGVLVAAVWTTGRAGKAAAVILLLGGVTQLGSHFVDGGRLDFRAAAAHLSRVAPEARVATTEALNLGFYAPTREVVPIEVEGGRPNAEWLVVPEHRLGLDASPELAAAVDASCVLDHRIMRPRYDYRLNALRIYRCPRLDATEP